MAYSDLREFIDELEKKKELKRIPVEVDPFLDTVPLNEQSPGLLAERQPLEQLRELHRLEVPGDSHVAL